MKKFFVMAVMAAASLTASAQWWAGGELELSGKHRVGAENSETTFSIKPEVGYSLTDKIDVAIALGYSHLKNQDIIFDEYYLNGTGNQFTVTPYARYKFVKAGNFFAFVDGGITFSTSHFNGVKNNINSFGVGFAPGIAYSVSDKVTLVSHLGDGLYYNHTWRKDDYHRNSYGFKFANSISFGAYYSF